MLPSLLSARWSSKEHALYFVPSFWILPVAMVCKYRSNQIIFCSLEAGLLNDWYVLHAYIIWYGDDWLQPRSKAAYMFLSEAAVFPSGDA